MISLISIFIGIKEKCKTIINTKIKIQIKYSIKTEKKSLVQGLPYGKEVGKIGWGDTMRMVEGSGHSGGCCGAWNLIINSTVNQDA